MISIIHRVNTIKELEKIPVKHGVEVDIRPYQNKLILNHEPYKDGILLDDYLASFKHAFIILDVKAEWIVEQVLILLKKHRIENYFLLGLSPPETFALVKKGVRKIAIRFSEVEPIENALVWQGKVDWCWVDVFTQLPLNKKAEQRLRKAGFKLCLVDPERWGRPKDIVVYQKQMKKEKIKLDAVMTAKRYIKQWTSQS